MTVQELIDTLVDMMEDPAGLMTENSEIEFVTSSRVDPGDSVEIRNIDDVDGTVQITLV